MGNLPKKLWTVGHSTHTLEGFLGILRAHKLGALVDVRLLPGSKRYPHFNRETLSEALEKAGVAYAHIPELGGRRKARPDSPNTAWRNASFRGYADHMETEEFQRGLEQLNHIASHSPAAVMCAEAVWWQCHRALISDWMKAHGVEVLHILSENKVEPHPFTSAARMVAGKLSYACEDAELPLGTSR